MQPTPPNTFPQRGFFVGPGAIFGLLALVAFVYLMDHAGKGRR